MTTVIRRFLLTLAIVILTVIIVMLLVVTRPEAKVEVNEPALTRVEVVRVEQRDILPEVTLTGVLRPRQVASLRFEVSGELQTRQIEPGFQVDAGDLLLQLEDADYRDALVEAESQLGETEASLKRDRALLELARENRHLAEREYARLEKLGKGSLASVSTLESSRQQLINLQSEEARLSFSLETSQARVKRLEAAISRAQRNLERTSLRAPFKGRVNRVMVETGDYVSANTLVVELIDTSTLELQVAVSSDVISALTLGQKLVVDVDGRSVEGGLVALQYDPDLQTHTHPLSVQIHEEGVVPGQLARVRLPLRPRKKALVVPASAILREEGAYYVFLVKNNRLERRSITPGIRYGEQQIVLAGIEPKARLVARDVDVLSDAAEVVIEDQRGSGD